MVTIFEIYGPKNGGFTERFLMVTIENYEMWSSKPSDDIKIIQNLLYGYFITVLQVIIPLILFVKNFYFLIFFYPKIGPSSSNTDENYTSDLTVKAKFLFPDWEIITRLGNYYLFGVMSLAAGQSCCIFLGCQMNAVFLTDLCLLQHYFLGPILFTRYFSKHSSLLLSYRS